MEQVVFTKDAKGQWEGSFEGKLLPTDIGQIKRRLTLGYRQYLSNQRLTPVKKKEVTNG